MTLLVIFACCLLVIDMGSGSDADNSDQKKGQVTLQMISRRQAQLPEKGCQVVADIVLIIDSSESLGDKNYRHELQFVANLTKRFPLGPQKTQFGALIFSTTIQKVFDLKDFSNNTLLANALISAPYIGKRVCIHRPASHTDLQEMFGTEAGGRDNAINIVILLTVGKYFSNYAVNALRARNITIMAVGMEPKSVGLELRNMVSSAEDVFIATELNSLDLIQEQIEQRVCKKVQAIKQNG